MPAARSDAPTFRMPRETNTRWSKRNGLGGVTRQTFIQELDKVGRPCCARKSTGGLLRNCPGRPLAWTFFPRCGHTPLRPDGCDNAAFSPHSIAILSTCRSRLEYLQASLPYSLYFL